MQKKKKKNTYFKSDSYSEPSQRFKMDLKMSEFRWQGSKCWSRCNSRRVQNVPVYSRFPHMHALQKPLNIPEHGWIMSYDRVLNMPGHISQGFKSTKNQGSLYFVKNTVKRDHTRNYFIVFSPRYTPKNTFWMENLTQR